MRLNDVPSIRLDERLRRSSLRRPAAEIALAEIALAETRLATGSLSKLGPATVAAATTDAAAPVGGVDPPVERAVEPLAPRTAPAVCWAPAECVGLEFGGV